jgi:MFS family permease
MENIETTSPAASEAPSTRAMMAPLITMTLVQVLICMAGFAVPVYAVPMARDLGVAPGTVGFYMSAVFSTAMVSAIICGQGVRRFGAIRMVQMALFAAAMAQGAFALGSLPLALIAALIMGMAYGPPTPSSSHILAQTTPPKLRPLVFSIKQTGVPAGAALAGAVVPLLVVLWGWRGAALAIAVACSRSAPNWTVTAIPPPDSRAGFSDRCAWCWGRQCCAALHSCRFHFPRCRWR